MTTIDREHDYQEKYSLTEIRTDAAWARQVW
jgi:hypothetical protein